MFISTKCCVVNVVDRFAIRRVMLLEFSQYLENYLWPNFNAESVRM